MYHKTKHKGSLLWLEFIRSSHATLSKIVLVLSLFPFIEDASLPVVWTVMFMLCKSYINLEDLVNDTYLSTLMKATLLTWLFDIVTRNFKISRDDFLLLYINPNIYDVDDHIDTKVEVNAWILSTLNNEKYIWIMKPGANFETSMTGPLDVLVALVNSKIGKVSSSSNKFVWRPFMRPFFDICCNFEIETWPNYWWKSWERFCFERPHIFGTAWYLFC